MSKRNTLKIILYTFRNFILPGLRTSHAKFFFNLMRGYLATRLLGRAELQYLEIMVTHACNARCDYCSNSLYDIRSKKRKLTPDKVEGLIGEAARMGIPIVVLLGGEPLLDPHLFDYLDAIHRHGMMSMIGTNGQLLTSGDILPRLKAAHVGTVVVSIYSTDPAVNDRATGLAQYLDKALAGIRRGKEMGINMVIKTVVNREHFLRGEIGRILDLARELDVPLSINPVVPTGAALGNYSQETLDRGLQEELDALVAEHPFMSTHLTSNYFGYGCPAGRAYMGVTAYGDVIPCFFIPTAYGNVWEEGLEKIHQRMMRTQLFRQGAGTCVAAYDDAFIRRIIVPCFGSENKSGQIPIPITAHPAYRAESETLEIDEA